MDVLLYIQDYEWPLNDKSILKNDINEISMRSCVSKDFYKKMLKIRKRRIKYYLYQFPPLKSLSNDMDEYLVKLVDNYVSICSFICDNNEQNTTLVDVNVDKVKKMYASMTNYAIHWRFCGAFINFDEELPKATALLYRILEELNCFCYQDIVLKHDDCYLYEDILLWLIFLNNIESITQECHTLKDDPNVIPTLEKIIFRECDHVHNGCRRVGAVNATRFTRQGYYYKVMQPIYVGECKKDIERNQRKYNNVECSFYNLSCMCLSRYEHLWSYHERCNAMPLFDST